jgi:hypothetical protein
MTNDEQHQPIEARLRDAIATIEEARGLIFALSSTRRLSNIGLEAALSAHERFLAEHKPLTGDDGVDGRIEDVDGDVEAVHAADSLLHMYRRAAQIALGKEA